MLEGAAAVFPERAEASGTRLDLAEAFLHPADGGVHAGSLTTKPVVRIGTGTDPTQ